MRRELVSCAVAVLRKINAKPRGVLIDLLGENFLGQVLGDGFWGWGGDFGVRVDSGRACREG